MKPFWGSRWLKHETGLQNRLLWFFSAFSMCEVLRCKLRSSEVGEERGRGCWVLGAGCFQVNAWNIMFVSRQRPWFCTEKEMDKACNISFVVMLAPATGAIPSSHINTAYSWTIPLLFLLYAPRIEIRSLLPHPTDMVSLSAARPYPSRFAGKIRVGNAPGRTQVELGAKSCQVSSFLEGEQQRTYSNWWTGIRIRP